jgi:hypothetical protein
LGTWKIHLKKLVHPLTGSTTGLNLTARQSPARYGTAARSWRNSKPIALVAATSKE